MTILLLLFAFSARLTCVHGQRGLSEEESDISDIQVKKCCGEGKRLDSSDVNTPQCVPHSSNFPAEIIVKGLDLTKQPGSWKVNLTVTFEAGGSRMPRCKGSRVFSVLEQDSWLTKKGKLVQGSQGHRMRHQDFCVDYDAGDRVGAVSCDACTKDHPCVSLCCPHGKALVNDPELGYEVCGTETVEGEAFSQEFWSKHDVQMEEYWEKHGIILKAPTNSRFNCPEPFIQDRLHIYPNWDAGRYTILPDGRLRGENITYMHQQQALHGDFTWDNDKFCVSYADSVYEDYDVYYYYDGVFDLTYHICYDGNLPDPDQVTETSNVAGKGSGSTGFYIFLGLASIPVITIVGCVYTAKK